MSEVKQYITLNKHLPDVPSAKEVNEGGQDLAAMNAILLKNSEELTLYIIKQDERLTLLENEKK